MKPPLAALSQTRSAAALYVTKSHWSHNGHRVKSTTAAYIPSRASAGRESFPTNTDGETTPLRCRCRQARVGANFYLISPRTTDCFHQVVSFMLCVAVRRREPGIREVNGTNPRVNLEVLLQCVLWTSCGLVVVFGSIMCPRRKVGNTHKTLHNTSCPFLHYFSATRTHTTLKQVGTHVHTRTQWPAQPGESRPGTLPLLQ